MISELINLSTGPVAISPQVMSALQEPPISHRSAEFKKLFQQTTELLNNSFHVQQSFLLSGSGTLANEVMLHQIKDLGGQGLILSNGEFGRRLIEQARRIQLDFTTHELEWGKPFEIDLVEKICMQHPVRWILFCHCETSTGVINDLDKITALAKRYNSLCFVDCMSTVGTRALDLSGVTMATASSGKGLASIPGLAVIFSNMELSAKKESPVYLDLSHYAANDGIPFTISSNLLKALYVSILQKLRDSHYKLLGEYGEWYYNILKSHDMVPFSNAQTKVFTLVTKGKQKNQYILDLQGKQLLLSGESEYLRTRQWTQLAMFGYYNEQQLQYVGDCLLKN